MSSAFEELLRSSEVSLEERREEPMSLIDDGMLTLIEGRFFRNDLIELDRVMLWMGCGVGVSTVSVLPANQSFCEGALPSGTKGSERVR